MIDANQIVGTHDIVLITLDTLRYDAACTALADGRLPTLASCMGGEGWQRRHAPGSFTYASHQAMFAGFLPTPADGTYHERLFALAFKGSETSGARTCLLSGSHLPEGLAARGYQTLCIGGVGFFNQQNPLGRVLPSMFQRAFWTPELGVTNPESTRAQCELAADELDRVPRGTRAFLFINISAIHQPNYHYIHGATADGVDTQAAALAYVDSQLPGLFAALRKRGPAFVICCSDHGTAYGEDGYHGHRLGHDVVWTVPYTEFVLDGDPS